MINQLKSIGIEKGKPFKPDAKTTAILNSVATELQDTKEILQGVPLYGSTRVTGSLKKLEPGESIEIRESVLLKASTLKDLSSMPVPVKAGFFLENNVVRLRDGNYIKRQRKLGRH